MCFERFARLRLHLIEYYPIIFTLLLLRSFERFPPLSEPWEGGRELVKSPSDLDSLLAITRRSEVSSSARTLAIFRRPVFTVVSPVYLHVCMLFACFSGHASKIIEEICMLSLVPMATSARRINLLQIPLGVRWKTTEHYLEIAPASRIRAFVDTPVASTDKTWKVLSFNSTASSPWMMFFYCYHR